MKKLFESDSLKYNVHYADKFEILDLEERRLHINGEIDNEIIDTICYHIRRYNQEDLEVPISSRTPIKIFITSNGGSVNDGYAAIDSILTSVTPVHTIVLGYAMSMGLLISLAGHVRYTFESARYLLHDGSSFAFDSTSKLIDRVDFDKEAEQRTKEYIISRSNITSDFYDKIYRVELYLFADQAKEHGFVDYIIGKDCKLEEVL